MCCDLDGDGIDNNHTGSFNPLLIIVIIFMIVMIFKSCGKNENDPVRNFEQYMIELNKNE